MRNTVHVLLTSLLDEMRLVSRVMRESLRVIVKDAAGEMTTELAIRCVTLCVRLADNNNS